MADELSAFDDIRAILTGIVQDGLKARPEGVHLTYVGAEFAKRVNAPFEQYLNVLAIQQKIDVPFSCRKLVPFIQRYCLDLFEVIKNANGTILLRTKDQIVEGDDAYVQPSVYHRFKKAVFVAFIRPLPDDSRRFLNLDTLGFTDGKRKPAGETWIEIPRKFITETPLNQPIDGPATQAGISAWMTENGLDIETFVDPTHKSEPVGASLQDLLRIIDSLPPDVCAKWSIPADVLRALHSNR